MVSNMIQCIWEGKDIVYSKTVVQIVSERERDIVCSQIYRGQAAQEKGKPERPMLQLWDQVRTVVHLIIVMSKFLEQVSWVLIYWIPVLRTILKSTILFYNILYWIISQSESSHGLSHCRTPGFGGSCLCSFHLLSFLLHASQPPLSNLVATTTCIYNQSPKFGYLFDWMH